MTNVEKIIVLANQLANDGKKPTVALIKAKLVNPTPLPQIISALRTWVHEPEKCEFTDEVVPKEENDRKSNMEDVVTLEELNNTLAPIKKELAELKALIKTLTEKG